MLIVGLHLPLLAMAAGLQGPLRRIGTIPYYISPTPLDIPPLDLLYGPRGTDTGPCTVIVASSIEEFNTTAIEDLLFGFGQEDDVWSLEFAREIIVSLPHGSEYAQLASGPAYDLGLKSLRASRAPIPNGPYFMVDGQLHKVSRLYPDLNDAFIVSTTQNPDDLTSYQSLEVSAFADEYPTSLTVAVPSRLYFKRSTEKPLAGLRFAMKDNQDLRGIRTGVSSRAFKSTYPPRNETATGVRKLLDAGAVLVGKLRTTQFADTEWATGDWIDYHAPFNPRADGYQGPSGSSAGSGAALATYDWLDFVTGSDSCGSIRSPAAVTGLFSMRSSVGASDMFGVTPWSPTFDTLGIITRDIELYLSIATILYEKLSKPAQIKKPKKLFYPTDFWPVKHPEGQKVFEAFIAKLEKFLGFEKTEVDLVDLWAQTNPLGTKKSLHEYFENTLPYTTAPDILASYQQLTRDHEKKFGTKPYFNPQGQSRFKTAPSVTKEMHEDGHKTRGVFKRWAEEVLLKSDGEGNSESILILPWTSGEPDYRDIYREAPSWVGEGFYFYYISPYAQAPEFILPIGQTKFYSRVTEREEWLPVSIGIIGAKDSDIALVTLIRDLLKESGLPTTTLTGQTAFPVSAPLMMGHTGQDVLGIGIDY